MKNTRRNQKRITRRFPVRFGEKAPQHVGFAKNLSLGGLEISSRTIFAPATYLCLSIEPEKEPIEAKGVVRWTSDSDRMAAMAGLKSCMGIELTERPESYVDLLVKMVDTFKDRRKHPRFGKVIKVVFESPKELIERYTQDISQGGIFIVSKETPGFDAIVEMRLIIAMTMAVIRVKGRVVYSISPAMARDQGLNPGFGVQFTHFLEDGDKRLAEYVASLQYS